MKDFRIRCLSLGACCLVVLLGGCQGLIPDHAPTAIISATPANGTAPLIVSLSASLSADDAAILEYVWEFPNQDLDPVYSIQAEQLVRLTVLDSAGQSDTAEVIIRVENNGSYCQLPTLNRRACPTDKRSV